MGKSALLTFPGVHPKSINHLAAPTPRIRG
jgi:hypothetical protein